MAHIFISYSHDDAAFAEHLAHDLKNERFEVWIDFGGIQVGSEWENQIFRGISACDFLIICLTPSAVLSDWVRREVLMARSQHKPIFPVLVQKEIETSNGKAETLKLLLDFEETRKLRDIQMVDFERNGYERAFQMLLKALPTNMSAARPIKRLKKDQYPLHTPNSFKEQDSRTKTDSQAFIRQSALISDLSEADKQIELAKRRYLEEKIQGFEDSQRNSFIPPFYSTGPVVSSKVRHERDFTTIYDMYNDILQFVLVGYPGVGKTVVMKELFKEIALRHLSENQSEPMPLWIELNEISNPIDADELFAYWCNQIYKLKVDFQQQLKTRPPVIFLDGLNEMPLATRTERAVSLRQWLINHKEVKVIISCRTRDYEDDQALSMGEYFSVVRVEPFERDQIYAFLQHVIPKHAQGLMRRIDDDEALFQIARIPLHLSMFAVLADIYSYRQLPNRLLDLYDEYLHQRYLREVQEKGRINYDWDELTKRLRKLAYRMAGSLSIATRTANRAMGKNALSDAFNLNLLTRTRENKAKKQTGSEKLRDTIRFYHQSLHGYFTLPQLLKEIRQIEFLTKSKYIPSFLFRLFISRNPSAIIRQIGDLGDTAELAVEALSGLLNSENKEIATAARNALIDIGVPSVSAMVRILEDKVESLQVQSTRLDESRSTINKEELALRNMLADIAKRDKSIDKKNKNAVDVLKRLKESAELESKRLKQKKDTLSDLEKLYEAEKNEPFLQNANSVLSGIGAASVAPILLFAFKTASTVVDEQVAYIFQKMAVGERPSLNVINAVARRRAKPEEFKMYMSEALGQISSSRAIEPLLPLLNDSNWEVRTEVIVALTKINKRTDISGTIIDPIIELLKFEDQKLPQTYAALLLKSLGHDAIKALLHMFSRAKTSERALLEQALFIVLDKNQALFESVKRKLQSRIDIDDIMSGMNNI